MTLSEYERRAWLELLERKRKHIERSPRKLLPDRVGGAVRRAGDSAKQLPGADFTREQVLKALQQASGGLAGAISRAGRATLTDRSVIKRYRRKGHEVEDVADIRALDLEAVDRAYPFVAHAHRHALAAAVSGAGSAFVTTGGEFALAVTDGIAAAPTLPVVAAAMVADLTATFGLMARSVGETARKYGYTVDSPEEEIFLMSVLSAGTAATSGGKALAYQELSQITQQLVRKATWKQLDEHVLVAATRIFATRMGLRLTQAKLGQILPVMGMAINGGLNYVLVDQVTRAAHYAYRERFLTEKNGGAPSSDGVEAPAPAPSDGGDAIGVLEILDEAVAEEGAPA